MMKTTIVLAGVLASALIVTSASAQDRGSYEEQQACTPDVFRLCGNYIPNVGEIVNCLKAEKRHLSPACRVVMDRRGGSIRKVKETAR
jgi:hypothetical protein